MQNRKVYFLLACSILFITLLGLVSALPSIKSTTSTSIVCNTNSDCGTDFTTGGYCVNIGAKGQIRKDQTSFKCVNPGTTESYCTNSTSTIIVNQCSYICFDGTDQCYNLDCDSAKLHPVGLLNGTITNGTTATITNGANISFTLGFAIYKVFGDGSTKNQSLFNSSIITIQPNSTVILSYPSPGCKYQTDIFCGDTALVPPDFNYHLIDSYTSNDTTCDPNSFCGDGIVEAGEQCDLGALNGQNSSCSSTCQFNKVPNVSEFGLITGLSTILGAIGVFLVVRKR